MKPSQISSPVTVSSGREGQDGVWLRAWVMMLGSALFIQDN